MYRAVVFCVLVLVSASLCDCEGATVPSPGPPPEQKGGAMKSATGFVGNIEKLTTQNGDFRRVLYTAKHTQLVVMALSPGEEIGLETHDVDQFFRVEAGVGEVVIDDTRTAIAPESAIIVPARHKHNVVNTGTVPLKLYTLYSPPQHREGVVHRTRADAEKDGEHFDGTTTK
jgi:mannose-6-phosphate isomerase-like protein (cupin superfamily)